MRLIVTRPRREADVWVKQLRQLPSLQIDAVALPLIQIDAATAAGGVTQVWANFQQRPNSYRALMFVSSNAVRYFFAENQSLALDFIAYIATKNIANNALKTPVSTRLWATGPGTKQALLEAGIPAEMIDAPAADAQQFDSEALWCCVKKQVAAGDKVLIVRGSSPASKDGQGTPLNGRPWLAEQLTAVGVQVETVVSYQRSVPDFHAADLALIEAARADGSVWLFSSSEAVANLRSIRSIHVRAADDRLVGLDWSKASAIATHPRIAQAATEAGFGVVYASRPLLSDVAACVAQLAVSIESKL